MKKIFYLWICILLWGSSTSAQEIDTLQKSSWRHNLGAWFYIWKDEVLFSPTYTVDKNWLHLEARYNYEDRNTFSGWFGYNFSGGKKFQYTITPMLGGIVGHVYGMAPGLELDFQFYGFEFSSQSEYVLDFNDKANYYFYNWTDFTYSPLDWLWFGFSMQRTRLYQTNLELQPGILVGCGYRWFGLTGYLFNLGFDDPYLALSLSITVPED